VPDAPIETPLINQFKTGLVPPFVIVALKLTIVPAQMLLADAEIWTPTASFGATATVSVLEITGFCWRHDNPDDITQVITSLLFGL
jgi:hypothetical protein